MFIHSESPVYRLLSASLVASLVLFSGCAQGTRETTAQRQATPAPAGDTAPLTAVSQVTPGGDTIHPRQTNYIPPWNFMSLSAAGVDTFQLEHPTYDGRGVTILVFDTGIDMSIPGLEHTSTGAQKVIDAIDFSNSNVIYYKQARLQGEGKDETATADGMPRIRGIGALDPPPADSRIFIATMDEANYKNSSVRDFDGDGDSRTRFGTILYRSADGWRVALDTDGDSSMAGEKGVANYREHYETFQIKQITSGKSPLTFAASIDTATKKVSFHYDMGGHGTHVAGIAAGFGINREPGFNGIAPGAQLISGKFSGDSANDNTVTGSMKRAYEYAGRLADSLQAFHRPLVVNMSFGIGSALEGRADIEHFIDTLLPNHPNLYVVTSAGNEGPGLSTTGIPSSALRIISVGAALPQGIGRDGYNAALDRDIIWDFSSRGGEVDKPDIVAPGTAVSTIPRYAFQSRESGTSMASPYTAGVVAVLLSAMRQEDSTWMPTQELMRRALRASARPMPDYAAIEQGGGMLDIRHAYTVLRDYRASGFANDLQLYSVSTFSPNYPDGHGTAAFWRSAYVPADDWRQSFTIVRYVPQRLNNDNEEFFRAYTLEPTAPWLHTVQSTVYIRGRDNAQVDVVYDRDKMREPGLYSARIIGRRASGKGPTAKENVEFELMNTVIVPYVFSADKGYSVSTPPQKVAAGVTKRFYFAPPAGAAAVTFTLSVPKGSNSIVSGKIADRYGVTSNFLSRAKGTERPEASNTIATSALGDGVIEVVVQSDPFEGPGGESEFTLSASCMMLTVHPTVTRSASQRELMLEATNTGSTPLKGDFNYTLKGYGRTVIDTMKGDFWSFPLTIRKNDGALWVRPRFSPEDYMRATDILVKIVDQDGNVQAQEALNTPSTWLFLPNFNREADSTKLWLQVNFGSANYGHIAPIPIEITENHMKPSDPHSFGGFSGTDLYPFIPESASTRLPSTAEPPRGYHTLGEIGFKPRGSEQTISFDFTNE